ncbi:MAG: hypothetical protein ABIP51_20140 [Bacteroidia bacterium]
MEQIVPKPEEFFAETTLTTVSKEELKVSIIKNAETFVYNPVTEKHDLFAGYLNQVRFKTAFNFISIPLEEAVLLKKFLNQINLPDESSKL